MYNNDLKLQWARFENEKISPTYQQRVQSEAPIPADKDPLNSHAELEETGAVFRSAMAPDMIFIFQTVTSLCHLGPPTGKPDSHSFKKKNLWDLLTSFLMCR